MNKGNKILVAILAFVLVCVVGYALFSENITVTGSATATGSFNIEASCTSGYNQVLQTSLGVTQNQGQGGYREDSCSVVDDKVTASVLLDYPSASRKFTVEFTNEGTIPAEVDLTKITDATTLCYKDSGKEEECMPISDLATDLKEYYYNYDFAGVVTAAGNLINDDSDEDFSEYISNTGVVRLNQNDKLLILIELNWTETDEVQEEYTKTNVSLKFDFNQITA